MEKEIKEKWVAALESGEYAQGLGRLYDVDSNAYCCLGVLAKVCNLTIDEGSDNILAEGGEKLSYDPLFDMTDGGNRQIVINSKELITMNDNGQSFTEIAQYIKENL